MTPDFDTFIHPGPPPMLPPPDLRATNTLALTNIPRSLFDLPDTLLQLRDQFETFGPIYRWIPLKTFTRVLVVFEETLHAMTAKSLMDRTVMRWHDGHSEEIEVVIRVYFGQHTPINPDPATLQLAVPDLEKNWLISPPGSPPIGWSQVREHPPNSTVLPLDLMHALARLDASASSSPFHPNGSDLDGTDLDLDFELDSEDFALGESAIPETPPAPPVMIIPHVSDPDDPFSTADDLPTIMVHDWDGNAAHDAAPVAGDGSLARAWSRQKHHPQGMQTRRIPIVNTPFPVGLGARPPTPTPTAMPPR